MSRYTERECPAYALHTTIEKEIEGFVETGFDQELKAQEDVYENMWENADIQITGDDELNRAVRFNIFHLMSTGNEHDDHVNVGAKLLTGEEYGGHAFWDSETYCLPYYLFHNTEAAKDLLLFRYNTLKQAKAENQNSYETKIKEIVGKVVKNNSGNTISLTEIEQYREYSEFKSSTFKPENVEYHNNGQVKQLSFEFKN